MPTFRSRLAACLPPSTAAPHALAFAAAAALIALSSACDADDPDGGAASPDTTSAETSTTGPDSAPAPPSSDDTDEDAAFIGTPDGPSAGQCNPGAQDCPEGQKCTSYVETPGSATVDATKCVDVVGDDLWGERCERTEGNDTCAAGFFCMTKTSGSTGEGTCLEYCDPAEGCKLGGECFAFNDGMLPVCEVTCDPLTPSCPGDQGCFAAFDTFICAMPGSDEGFGGDGDPCEVLQSCDPGLICAEGTAGCGANDACCTPFCDLKKNPDECEGEGERCVAALDQPQPGLEDVGFCTVPSP